MATTGTTTATTATKEEKASIFNNRLDKATKDMATEKDTATKEKAKDTTTTNKEEKEQKESRQQMFATDADYQDTWPNNAEWRSTTATLEPSTPMTRQMTGTMHQLALPQPPQAADPVPISGLHEVTIAMIGTAQQLREDNKKVRLMIDSGAATHVCPLWFAPQFPLQLEHGTGPQLRTVTNQHIKLFGYRWACMTNHSGQQIGIPFYVCEVKQAILSVTSWWNKVSNDTG